MSGENLQRVGDTVRCDYLLQSPRVVIYLSYLNRNKLIINQPMFVTTSTRWRVLSLAVLTASKHGEYPKG